jgi:hypothetical protein
MGMRTGLQATLLFLVLAPLGCSDGGLSADSSSELGFSTHDLVIGESLEVYTQNIDPEAHSYRLTFEGTYLTDLGETENVLIG